MITGFNPADMYAADHIRRVLQTFPGVFTGIGEFTIHKEFVSSKIAGETASLTNPALDRILDFAGEVGLVVILHNDIDMPFPKPGQDPYLAASSARCFRRHPKTTIIWAHCGLGPHRPPGQGPARRSSIARSPTPRSPTSPSTSPGTRWRSTWWRRRRRSQAAADLINRHPTGSCSAPTRSRPTDQAKYLKVYDMYAPLFAKLTPEASEKVRKGNYERLFDEARAGCAPGRRPTREVRRRRT